MKRVVEPQVPIQGINLGDLVAGKVEAEEVPVLPQPVEIGALGYDADVALDVPPEQDLRRRLAVPVGHLGDGRVVEE